MKILTTPTKTPLRRALALALLSLLALGAAFAQAEPVQKGDLQVTVSGKLSPHTLPRTGTAPVAVTLGGKITTTDQTEPPQLQKLVIEINRHGHIEPTGLKTCPLAQIQTADNNRALAACGRALVGSGQFLGTITLPGAAPYPIKGKLLVFNGMEGRKHVLFGHIFSPTPFSTSFVIPFEIKNGGHGEFGTTLTANLKKALGTQRNLTGIEMTLNRRYSYRGKRRSYVSAGCPAPKGFPSVHYPLARSAFTFATGVTLTSTLERSCGARG